MSISKAIYKILSSETDLSNLVSTRIFPSVIPQNESYPSLMYEIKDVEPIQIKATRSPKMDVRIVIGVHATTYADVQNISDIIIAVMERYKDRSDYSYPATNLSETPYTAGCSIVEGYWIQEVFYESSFDIFNDHLRVYEKYLEFDLRYIVNPASMGAFAWYPTIISGNTSTYNNLLSTSDTLNTPPTADEQQIKLFYDASGSTSMNLTDSGAFDPEWYSAGYLYFKCGFTNALSTASATTFSNGNTIFFVFQTDVATDDFLLYLINDSSGNYFQVRALTVGGSVTHSVSVSINSNLTQFVGTTETFLNNKIYFAFSWGGENDEAGEWEMVDPNSTTYNNKDNYNDFSDTGAGNFKFEHYGSMIQGSPVSVNTNNKVFETIIFDKKLTFGGGQYNRIKDYLINKHNLI